MKVKDPASCANFTQVKLKNLDFEWTINFDEKIFIGKTKQIFEIIQSDTNVVRLDCRDITLNLVQVNGINAEYERWSQFRGKQTIGDCINIHIGNLNIGQTVEIYIEFTTSPNAASILWLTKEQTKDHLQPMLFSLNEPIAARTILPCMDTPSVKCPYHAKVSVPSSVLPLMSALRIGECKADHNIDGYMVYEYEQPIPIPSYLIAIIVGVFESCEISNRMRVWAEPSLLNDAAYEFALSEERLQCIEKIFGEYPWNRCDMVVLPPSSIYGGMENPNLIYLTPTVITGDRSLTSIVIHELIHSWCGNLVTNATWEDMWLNEGITTYYERRIYCVLYGQQYRDFLCLKAWTALLMTAVFEQYEPDDPFTQLVQNHSEGVDPNEAFSSVIYEKGQCFFYHLEQKLGQEDLDKFFRYYFKKYMYKSVDSYIFKEELFKFFEYKNEILKEIDFDMWLFGRGMPTVKPKYDESFQEQCLECANKWIKLNDDEIMNESDNLLKQYNNFVQVQREEFLSIIRNAEPLTHSKIEIFQNLYQFNSSTNCEIKHLWIRIAIRAKWKPIIPIAYKFITDIGRLKLVRPIYKDLHLWSETSEEVIKLYYKNLPLMHPVGAEQISFDLGLFVN